MRRVLDIDHVRTLLPLPTDRLALRATTLGSGLVAYGVSCGLILQADLGVDPWDVLHQGLARPFGERVGTWTIGVGLVVLPLWMPLRERYGVAAVVLNALATGLYVGAGFSPRITPEARPRARRPGPGRPG